MSRRRRVEEDPPEVDTWIWGNNRGGGGAPLKDIHGNTVTNLKKVLEGTVKVDYSPSSPIKHSNNYDDDYRSPIKGLENYDNSFTKGRGAITNPNCNMLPSERALQMK